MTPEGPIFNWAPVSDHNNNGTSVKSGQIPGVYWFKIKSDQSQVKIPMFELFQSIDQSSRQKNLLDSTKISRLFYENLRLAGLIDMITTFKLGWTGFCDSINTSSSSVIISSYITIACFRILRHSLSTLIAKKTLDSLQEDVRKEFLNNLFDWLHWCFESPFFDKVYKGGLEVSLYSFRW